MKITFTESDIKEMIQERLAKIGHTAKAADIRFEVSTRWEGYGADEHMVPVFRGCSVDCSKPGNSEPEKMVAKGTCKGIL